MKNEMNNQSDVRRLVRDYYARLEHDAAPRAAPRRRDAGSGVTTFVVGVLVGATVAAAHLARRP